jgi:CheY-like chemotaxis protein
LSVNYRKHVSFTSCENTIFILHKRFNFLYMSASGPIIFVEDDIEDQEILQEVMQSIGIENKILFFREGKPVLDYLRTTTDKPLIIITDVNMPGMDGMQLRTAIFNDDFLRLKSIPYIFLSTSDGKSILRYAYEMQIQGFFQKEVTFDGIRQQIKLIIDYWKTCKHPNNE